MYHLWDSLAVQEFARVYSIKFHVSLICEHIKYLSRQYQNINWTMIDYITRGTVKNVNN